MSACSHEWDALEVLPGGPGGGDASSSSSSTSSNGMGGAGGSSSSSSSGGSDCGALLPHVAPCDTLTSTFDDSVQFDADWYLAPGAGTIGISNGQAAIQLAASNGASFASTHPDFNLNDCGIWVEIVQVATAPDVMVRLSIGEPFGLSIYSIGVINQKLEVHINGTSLFSAPYVAADMRYVRMREAGGKIFFDHSSDGRCWTEDFSASNSVTALVEGRISVSHVPNGPGNAADARFDNYCIGNP